MWIPAVAANERLSHLWKVWNLFLITTFISFHPYDGWATRKCKSDTLCSLFSSKTQKFHLLK